MFQNAYQNGLFFEVFDPKTPQDKTKNLYKLQNVQPNHKVFDKALKTFIYEFVPNNSRITFPKEDRKQLYLIQQYLNIQVQFTTADWNIQLTVSDLTKTKRRIILSPAVHKLEKKPFFLKYNCPSPKTNTWANLCIDLYSFIEGFKGQTYRSLDIIQLGGGLKLRRIFTTNQPVSADSEIEGSENLLLPKNLLFPAEVEYAKQFIQYSEGMIPEQINISNEVGLKYSKVTTMKSMKRENTKKLIEEQKQEKNPKRAKVEQVNRKPSIELSQKAIQVEKPSKLRKQEIEKKFLANTNGIVSFKDKASSNKKDDSTEEVSKSNITPLSTGKGIKKKREPLSKTNLAKEKKTSIEKVQQKNNLASQKSVNKNSQKLNPWRSSVKRKNETGRDSPQRAEDTRKIQSAQTALFVTQNNLIEKANCFKQKHFDRNSDCSRQSDYFELSQKFSTLNEGKFFKNEKPQHALKEQQQKQHFHDEIQQNIEVETNSHYSNSQRNSACKNKQNLFVVDLQQKPLQESINDSLDEFNAAQLNQKQTFLSQNQSYFNMSSRFGFGQKMMSKFMKQLERPYSPPLCQKQLTEDGEKEEKDNNNEKNGVELLYDPVLNCYYDHKTHTYYELKN